MGWVVNATLRPLHPGTHCTGGWVGPRALLLHNNSAFICILGMAGNMTSWEKVGKPWNFKGMYQVTSPIYNNYVHGYKPSRMRAVHNYIPETNHVSRVDTAVAVLQLQHTLQVILSPMLNISYFCVSTPPPVAPWRHAFMVRCSGIFWVILKMIPAAPVTVGIAFVSKFHTGRASVVRVLYFEIFSTSLFIKFMSSEFAISNTRHVPFRLSRIMIPMLLLG